MVGHYATARDVAAGGGATAVSTIIGPFMTFGMFLGLVGAGLINRRRPEVHKRLVATLLILWPAWFRFRHFFPAVPRPDLWFGVVCADSLILLTMLRDRLVLGRVHPVYLWVGTALIVETATEALLFYSAGWRVVAGWVWGGGEEQSTVPNSHLPWLCDFVTIARWLYCRDWGGSESSKDERV